MSTGGGPRRGEAAGRSVRPWLEIVAVTALLTTLAAEAMHASGLAGAFIAAERAAVEALLAAWGVEVVTLNPVSFIAFTPGAGVVTVKLVPSCSSMYPLLAFIVAGLVIPGLRPASRLTAILVYAPAIFAFNIVRVAVTAYLGAKAGPLGVRVFHDYAGTALGIAFFGVLWVNWLVRALPGAGRAARAPRALAAALVLALALAPAPADAGDPLRVLVVVTDPPDYYYAAAWATVSGFNVTIVEAGRGIGLSALREFDVVVLLDPNYDSPDGLAALQGLARVVLEYVEEGGAVVTTLNGVTLLKSLGVLTDYGVSCGPAEPATGPDDYNVSVYCLAEAPPYSTPITLPAGVAYATRHGGGVIAVVPYNIVWAYNATRNPVYLDMLTAAVEAAASHGSGSGAIMAGAVAAAAAAAAGLAQEARPRNRSGGGQSSEAVAVLGYRRVGGEDVLGNPLRRRILELLEAQGALYFNELWRALGASKATVAWHISVLEREGLIGIVVFKRYKIVYLEGRSVGVLERLWRERPRELCAIALAAAGETPLEAVARRLRTRPGAIAGVVEIARRHLDVVIQWCRGGSGGF